MTLLYSIHLFNVLILDFNTLLKFVRTFKYISSSESFNKHGGEYIFNISIISCFPENF